MKSWFPLKRTLKYFSITVSICQGKSCGTVFENHLNEHQAERPRKQYPFFVIQFRRNAKKKPTPSHYSVWAGRNCLAVLLCSSHSAKTGQSHKSLPTTNKYLFKRMVTFQPAAWQILKLGLVSNWRKLHKIMKRGILTAWMIAKKPHFLTSHIMHAWFCLRHWKT